MPGDAGFSAGEILRLLWARRSIVALATASALAAAAVLSFVVLSPTYEASTLLLVAAPLAPAGGQDSSMAAISVDHLIATASTEHLARSAAERLRSSPAPLPFRVVRAARVTPVRGTNLLQVTVRAPTSLAASALASAWGEAIIAHADTLSQQQVRRVLGVLQGHLASVTRDALAAERALQDFRASSQILPLEGRIAETIHLITFYESRLIEQQLGLPPSRGMILVSRGGGVVATSQRLPRPAQIRRLLGTLQSRLAAYQADLVRERQRESELLRRVELFRDTLRSLERRREELRASIILASGRVTVATPPSTPLAPVSPRKGMNMAVAAILGLLGGSLLALGGPLLHPPDPAPEGPSADGPGDDARPQPSATPRVEAR